jgi:hypothetical protein
MKKLITVFLAALFLAGCAVATEPAPPGDNGSPGMTPDVTASPEPSPELPPTIVAIPSPRTASTPGAESPIIALYIFEHPPDERLSPYVSLMDNGNFSFHYGGASSHAPHGTFAVEGDRLILDCGCGLNYVFRIEEDAIYLIADESGVPEYAPVKDGSRFVKWTE